MTAAPSLFGTDGIRGRFGEPPLDRETVTAFGARLAELLADAHGGRPRVVIGGDTRESTPTISRWLAAGLTWAGAAIEPLGVVPTPAVARLVIALGADAGLMVSASHNPYPDNGIKVFGADGFKLDDLIERELELRLADRAKSRVPQSHDEPSLAAPAEAHAEHYLTALESAVGGDRPLGSGDRPLGGGDRPFAGLRVVLDTGHGAASRYAGPLFERLGAHVRLLNDQPNGRNVNDRCGSTAPDLAARAVLDLGFDFGFAFDGDADRVILCDEQGRVRDGDEILFLWASTLAEQGALEPPAVVATSMSNLGLERALLPRGIAVVRCGVGDREVVRSLREHGLRLGGEPSGHLVDLAHGTTGDGLLTAAQIARVLAERALPVSAALADFERFPQILRSLPVASKPPLEQLPRVAAAVAAVERDLGAEGRLVLRYSGTEPLVRIMIEGPSRHLVESLVSRLADVVDDEIGMGARSVGAE